jgi:hypothetical protein
VINFSASGRMNEMVSMRLRCTGRVLIETRQLPYRGPYSLASHDFKLRSRLPGISFPSPGVYNLDIMINGTPAYTLEIHMV